MIKHLLSISILFLGLNGFSQSFSAMYDFSSVSSGSATNTGTTDPTPPPTVTGITFGAFTAVGTSTGAAASAAFAFTGWDATVANGNDAYATYTGAINPGKYYEVSVTPNSSTITLNSITFNMARSSTGPRNWSVKSNRDGYTANLTATISPANVNLSVVSPDVFYWTVDSYTVASGKQERGSTINLTGPNFMNQTTPFTFRFYVWNAESGGGSFRIDTVRFNGVVGATSGINEFMQDLNSTIKIYPNPSNDGYVYLDTKKVNYSKIEVVSILGTTVLTENKEAAATEKIKLNLNTLPAGTYFVRVTAGDKVYTERFFITK
jgi:hypothetical protein